MKFGNDETGNMKSGHYEPGNVVYELENVEPGNY